jgi:Fe-S cluster assembly iron-binding protein IscA
MIEVTQKAAEKLGEVIEKADEGRRFIRVSFDGFG